MTVKSIKVLCSLNQCIHGNLKRKSDYSKYLRRKSKLFINRDYFLNQNAPKYCMSCSNLMKSDHRSAPDFLLSVHENLKKPHLRSSLGGLFFLKIFITSKTRYHVMKPIIWLGKTELTRRRPQAGFLKILV